MDTSSFGMNTAGSLVAPITDANAFTVLANCPVGNRSATIDHHQLSPDEETLLICPYDPDDFGHPKFTRTYQVTNDTGTPGTDYHFGDLVFGTYGTDLQATVTGTPSVPEPATLALAALGLAGLGVLRRKR